MSKIPPQYAVGWNDTMEAFRDLQSRDEPTTEYLARIDGIADTRLQAEGPRGSLADYFRGVLGACVAFRADPNVKRLEVTK